MLILYYWPGASSMVPHVVLEEIGTAYERTLVNLAQGEHKSDPYLKINPHGKVPALAIDDTILTENVGILTYLGRRFPESHLLPGGSIEEARCLSMMAWFASAVHTTFAHVIRPERFATDSAAHSNIKETARGIFWGQCKEINGLVDGNAWIMGAHYTVCDPYALFFTTWAHASSCRCTSLQHTRRFPGGCWNAAQYPRCPGWRKMCRRARAHGMD